MLGKISVWVSRVDMLYIQWLHYEEFSIEKNFGLMCMFFFHIVQLKRNEMTLCGALSQCISMLHQRLYVLCSTVPWAAAQNQGSKHIPIGPQKMAHMAHADTQTHTHTLIEIHEVCTTTSCCATMHAGNYGIRKTVFQSRATVVCNSVSLLSKHQL